MKELRCILFNEREVATATVERRRRMREYLPVGTVQKAVFEAVPGGGYRTVLHMMADDGMRHELPLGEAEVASALVAYCLSRKVPLPADADKFLQVINDHMALMIMMDVEKGKTRKASAARKATGTAG